MTLLRVDASIRSEGSASRELADVVELHWRDAHPDAAVVRRDLGIDPLPSDAWPLASSAGFTAPEDRTERQRDAVALAATVTDELADADAVLIAAPLYNFGISQHIKAWFDLVITDPRGASSAPTPLLRGVPVVLTTVRGGAYGAGTPREGWDHGIGYLERILRDVWGAELTVVEREFTLVGVVPALDEFTDHAAQLHADALDQARDAGRALHGRNALV